MSWTVNVMHARDLTDLPSPQSTRQPRQVAGGTTGWLAMTLVASTLIAGTLAAPRAHAGTAGEVTHVSGALLARKHDGSLRILAPRSRIEEGDLLVTSGETYARVMFVDGAEITLRPNSQLKIEQYAFVDDMPESNSARLRLVKGGLRTIAGAIGQRQVDSYRLSGPVAAIDVRGGQFGVLLCQGDCDNMGNQFGQPPADGLHFDVTEGAIAVSNAAGDALIAAGNFGFVANATTVPVRVSREEAVSHNMPTFSPGTGSGIEPRVIQ